jgi:hypothetical protein
MPQYVGPQPIHNPTFSAHPLGKSNTLSSYELVILCGRNVRQPKGKPETITKEDILIKYGALLE